MSIQISFLSGLLTFIYLFSLFASCLMDGQLTAWAACSAICCRTCICMSSFEDGDATDDGRISMYIGDRQREFSRKK
jgi:hypothetical protein